MFIEDNTLNMLKTLNYTRIKIRIIMNIISIYTINIL